MASSTSWTAEDLKKNASNWTLEGDCKLLEFMKNISKNIESRANNTNHNINHMVLNLEETNVALENVSNKLSALQNSHFVENRVYEDDETIANVAEVPVEIEHEAEKYDPTETLNKVLKNSLKMMENYYEKVSIDVEDSDDEEGVSKSVVYKPKNAFEGRSLPHMIGSKEWKANWHIGLCDSEEENSEDGENLNEYSDESENDSLAVYLPSNERTVSESESSIWGLNPNKNIKPAKRYSMSSEEEASSNALKPDSVQPPNAAIMPQTAVAREIERFYVHKPRDKESFEGNAEEPEKSVATKNVSNQPQPRLPEYRRNFIDEISNLFSNEPPELDEVDQKQEREHSELFCESEDELVKPGQLDNTNKNREIQEKISNIRQKPVNLFDDDDFDSFMEELDKKTTAKHAASSKSDGVTNLFEDTVEVDQGSIAVPPPFLSASKNSHESYSTIEDSFRNKKKSEEFLGSDHEEDLFKSISAKSKKAYSTSIRSVKNLFDDESSEDEFENVFKVGSKIVVKTQDENVKDDDEIGNSTVGNLKKTISNSRQSHASPQTENTLPSFERFPSADLVENKRLKEANNAHTPDVKTINLFSDDLSDNENLFGTNRVIPVAVKRTTISTDDNILPQQSVQDATNFHSNEFEDAEEKQNVAESVVEYPDKNNDDTSGDFSKRLLDNQQNQTNLLQSIFLENEPPDDEDIFRLSENDATKNNSSSRIEQIPTSVDRSNDCLNPFNEHSIMADNLSSSSVAKKVDFEQITRSVFNDQIKISDDDDFLLSDENVRNSIAETKHESAQDNSEDKQTIEDNKTNEIDVNTEQTNSEWTSSNQEAKNVENVSDILKKTGKIEEDSSVQDRGWPNSPNSFHKADEETSNEILPNDIKIAFSVDNKKIKSDSDNIKGAEDSSTVSVPTYNAISLFQDIPPEDDFQSPADSKRLHSIFYDDFAETIVSSNSNYVQNTPSNYFFSEEPPPDSLGDSSGIGKDMKSDEINEKAVKEHPMNEKGIPEDILEQTDPDNHFSVSELIKKVGSNQTKTDLKPNTSLPARKKLSNNLNINVAALLPGAKRPNSSSNNFQEDLYLSPEHREYTEKNLEASQAQGNVSTENENFVTIPRSIISEDSNPQKLISLNKTRVKIQTKRRPSTRKGRQESYKQFVESDATDMMISSESEVINEQKESLESSHSYPSDVIPADLEKDLSISNMTTFLTSRKPKIDDDWLRKPLHPPADNPSSTETKSFLTQFAEKIASENYITDHNNPLFSNLTRHPEHANSATKNDSPLRKHSSGEINRNISVGQKGNVSLFQDDSDDDLFSSLNEIKAASSKNAASLPKTKTNTREKMFSSDEDDDNNDIFAKKLKVNSKPKKHILKKPLSSNSKLFDDDDDDGEDLFGSSSATNKGTTRSMNLPPKQAKKTSVGSVTGDNPLADLLN